jgi:hypothetical protein
LERGASFAADIEPEYITISCKIGLGNLTRNNGVAKVDLAETISFFH